MHVSRKCMFSHKNYSSQEQTDIFLRALSARLINVYFCTSKGFAHTYLAGHRNLWRDTVIFGGTQSYLARFLHESDVILARYPHDSDIILARFLHDFDIILARYLHMPRMHTSGVLWRKVHSGCFPPYSDLGSRHHTCTYK